MLKIKMTLLISHFFAQSKKIKLSKIVASNLQMKKAMGYTPASLKATYGLGLVCLTFLGMSSLQAQSISPQTLTIAGGYSQVGGYSLGYSMGEESSITYYTTATASTLSAGFLQDFGFLERDHLVLDLSLSNASFEGSTTQFFIPVGDFTVKSSRTTTSTKAPLFSSLYGPGYDNRYFEIKDNVLFWSSADPAPGKETFLILAQVLDRKGNQVAKFFEIKRTRTAFSSLVVSNTFTPNGDGVNDKWSVPGLRFYEGARISVFDKVGSRMFYTEIPDQGWDGTFNGKELPIGSYFWVIEALEIGEMRRGILNLIRK
jgi:gliding motility-associated-like protein